MKKNISIKNWAIDDRPREKLIRKGKQALSNSELIAILIGSGNSKKSAVELSKEILASFQNNITELAKANVSELMKFSGIGEAKAINIIAALELSNRRIKEDVIKRKQITSSSNVSDLFAPILAELKHEEFWVLLLNRANEIIEEFNVSKGGLSSTVIDVRIIMKNAIDKLASGIILVHNHPSGNMNPSDSDKVITKKIKDAAMLLDINLLDHVIIADKSYFSFNDNNIL